MKLKINLKHPYDDITNAYMYCGFIAFNTESLTEDERIALTTAEEILLCIINSLDEQKDPSEFEVI